jgi:WD40 repeat protein/class 3 adenylate cyclase
MAVILAADVAGYSRLIGEDEERTLATLGAYREIVDRLIIEHEGRVFGSAGDSVVAEFASPVEALRCATDIQLELARCNGDLPVASQLRFRIGINLGDVVIEGDNLMGDGVNVAARLEAMARPGGICIAEAVYAQARDRLSLDFVDLGEHRLKNIARPVRAYRVPLASEEQVRSPFRGLEVFEFENADLFFGRTRAIAACTERLQQLAAGGKAFLLIYGMSGSGKSSLLRAGLLPSITRAGAMAGITVWRRCLIRPSEGPDAVAALTTALFREGALPELALEAEVDDYTLLCRSAPDRALALIRRALDKAAGLAGAARAQIRLLVAVDQLEELFTTEKQPLAREALVRLMATLAASDLVWLIATIRSDFFHRCGEIPGFSALKDGLASYELLPPTGPEIAQIIREPARAAGLQLEESPTEGRLEDVLQQAALADPGSLPLLEFVLDALFEAGREKRLLTFADYRALGGLEGAIARRADEVVAALSTEVQDALPSILRAVTTIRPDDSAVAAAPASRNTFAHTPAQTALLDALIAARLLVSDENIAGQAVVRLAHEALVTRWPRARDLINADRHFLETRARLRVDAARWDLEDRNPDLLLPPGKRLAEGEELILSRREDVDHQIVQYVEASSSAQRAAAEKEREADRRRIEAEEAAKREHAEREAERRGLEAAAAKRLARRTRFAALVALVLAVIAGAGAIAGFRGQKAALEARDLALRNQSLSLSSLSVQQASSGDSELAILLALEALPRDAEAPDRPQTAEAEAALFGALSRHQELAVLRHDDAVTDGTFSPDGQRVVTSSFDHTARIWNVSDGKELAVLKGHIGTLKSAVFSPDGKQVLTAADDGTARVWDMATGKQLYVLNQTGDVRTAVYSRDGRRIFTASEFSGPSIWNAQTGALIIRLPGTGWTSTAILAISPDGQTLVSSEPGGNVQLWNANDGTFIRILEGPWEIFADMAFNPQGTQLVVVPWSGAARLWRVADWSQVATLSAPSSDANQATFSHDGRFVAVVAIDGSARLWNTRTGELARVFGEETRAKVEASQVSYRYLDINGAFSPDDQLFATGSAGGLVRIWDVQSGAQVSVLRGHDALVEHIAFSPDGRHLLSASHDGTARLWDVDGVLTTTLPHGHPPTFAAFSPDGTRLVTGGGDVVGYIWDVARGEKITTFSSRSGGLLQLAVFGPDGRHLATTSQDGVVRVWNATSGREETSLPGNGSKLLQLQFSSDGSLLASASGDGKVRLRRISTGAAATEFDTGSGLRDALFSPDSKLVMVRSNDNAVQLWKTDGIEIGRVTGPDSHISAQAFSPDGRLVAVGSFDGTAQVWSVEEGRVTATMRGHVGAVTDLVFGDGGKLLATASLDGTVRLWSVRDGAAKSVLKGGTASVDSIALSPNGLYVATGSFRDRSVRLWSTNTGRQLALLVGQNRTGTIEPAITRAAFNSNGTQIAAISGDRSVKLIRVFPSLRDLIVYAEGVVQRQLTPCERERFFLPIQDAAANCQS